MLFCSSVSAQITVTHFNAEWNAANKVEWFEKLDDCELAKVDIVADPKLQDKHKIIIVPTIVVFKDGEEIKGIKQTLALNCLQQEKKYKILLTNR